MNRFSKADIRQLRQETQYTCCAASIAAALAAHGKKVTEEDVNNVLGAAPMAGATWEAMLATVQYFGLRGRLVVPATVRMLKEWTDNGTPVVIAWNPENRPWSHASVVFHVEDDLTVHIMDPNIPNPDETERVLSAHDFCMKWSEKISDTLLVRRPAMAIEREITQDGKQVVASTKKTGYPHLRDALPPEAKMIGKLGPNEKWEVNGWLYLVEPRTKKVLNVTKDKKAFIAKAPTPVHHKNRDNKIRIHLPLSVSRDPAARALINQLGKGPHKNRERDVDEGRSRKPKYPQDWSKDAMTSDLLREEIARQIEAGFQDKLKGLWKTYKKNHPKSEKPPKSLIDEAKAEGGKAEGDKDEGGGGGKPAVRRVGPVTQVDDNFVKKLKSKLKDKVQTVGKGFAIDLDGDDIEFTPSTGGWFKMEFEKTDDVMKKLWDLYDSIGGVDRVNSPSSVYGSDERMIRRVTSKYLSTRR